MTTVFPVAIPALRFAGAVTGAVVGLARGQAMDRRLTTDPVRTLTSFGRRVVASTEFRAETYRNLLMPLLPPGPDSDIVLHKLLAATCLAIHLNRTDPSTTDPVLTAFTAGASPLLRAGITTLLTGVQSLGAHGDLRLLARSDQSPVHEAVAAVESRGSFREAIDRALEGSKWPEYTGVLAGALAGAAYTPAGIPPEWIATVEAPAGDDATLGSFPGQLRTIALTLDHAAGEPIHPREVLPDLFLSNLRGAMASDPALAVLSFCRVDAPLPHDFHYEYLLNDDDRHGFNPLFAENLDHALRTIEALLTQNRRVLIHCRFGRSRTGMLLRAWLMWRQGLTEPAATELARDLWPPLSTWNEFFTQHLAVHEFPERTTGLAGHDFLRTDCKRH